MLRTKSFRVLEELFDHLLDASGGFLLPDRQSLRSCFLLIKGGHCLLGENAGSCRVADVGREIMRSFNNAWMEVNGEKTPDFNGAKPSGFHAVTEPRFLERVHDLE